MSEDRSYRAAVRLRGERQTFEIIRPTRTSDGARLEHLQIARRAAQAHAYAAYDEWSHHPTAAAYAVYRAAQDRADAAQDQLAAVASRGSVAHRAEP